MKKNYRRPYSKEPSASLLSEDELAQRWNPKADKAWPGGRRSDYITGYSDGFYGYRYGAGHDEPTDAYRHGFDHGKIDNPPAKKADHGPSKL